MTALEYDEIEIDDICPICGGRTYWLRSESYYGEHVCIHCGTHYIAVPYDTEDFPEEKNLTEE